MKLISIRVQGRPAVYGVVGDGPPVVFLHGWSLGCRSYKRCLTALASQGHTVVAPSLPGFGGTADLPPDLFTLAGYGEWVSAFIRQVVAPTQPVPLIGHSFGGGVAIRAAHDAPDLVGQLIVINSVGGAQWRLEGDAVRAVAERPVWDWGLHLVQDLNPPWHLARLLQVVGPDVTVNLLRNPGALWRVGRLAARADLSRELASLQSRQTPILIVWGHGDKFLPEMALQSLREVAQADYHTVDGSHTWLLTRPDTFCHIITNVLHPAEPALPTGSTRSTPNSDAASGRVLTDMGG